MYFFDISISKSDMNVSYNGVHFFDILISKSRPILRCFEYYDLEMYFAPQRRALFDILISKSGPKMGYFINFNLEICFVL